MIFLADFSFAEVMITASLVLALIVVPAVVFALVRRVSMSAARIHGGRV